jgi:hypothetical protein
MPNMNNLMPESFTDGKANCVCPHCQELGEHNRVCTDKKTWAQEYQCSVCGGLFYFPDTCGNFFMPIRMYAS